MTSETRDSVTGAMADRWRSAGRVIHWVTVALVIGLAVTPLLQKIDPHGPGNPAFIWHSTLGLCVYVLTIVRVLLWYLGRDMDRAGSVAGSSPRTGAALMLVFYAGLLLLPITGWMLAREEGAHVPLFLMPLLPQWYHEGLIRHTGGQPDTLLVLQLTRLHTGLAVAMVVLVVLHVANSVRVATRDAPGVDHS